MTDDINNGFKEYKFILIPIEFEIKRNDYQYFIC